MSNDMPDVKKQIDEDSIEIVIRQAQREIDTVGSCFAKTSQMMIDMLCDVQQLIKEAEERQREKCAKVYSDFIIEATKHHEYPITEESMKSSLLYDAILNAGGE